VKAKAIWLDGQLTDWSDAVVHVTSYGLNYGIGFFEGINCHATESGPAIFRLRDHIGRLRRSAAIYGIALPYSDGELVQACNAVVVANGFTECYLRPLVFMADAASILDARFRTAVIATEHGPHGPTSDGRGVRALVSSFQRMAPNALPLAAKATGQYLNSFLAQTEALRAGCDVAILLNATGYVADGWAHNVFVVSDGMVRTPPVTASALAGITRDSVMSLAADAGIQVGESELLRSDLYLAEECFLTGTAAGLVPVISVDGRTVGTGEPGPMTTRLRTLLDDVQHGRSQARAYWLEHVQ
jgi:branched-chain amino acid aminotransferase